MRNVRNSSEISCESLQSCEQFKTNRVTRVTFLPNKKEYTESVVFSGLSGPSPLARRRLTVKDYLELTKPRITWLIVMSTAIGYYFGHSGPWSVLSVLHTLIGTALMASGTAALNQWYERDADLLMNRTKFRPFPSGRVHPRPCPLVWHCFRPRRHT